MAEEKEVFVRKASGLTRVISAWDALIYAFCNPGILYAMLYITWGPAAVGPGADMPFAVLTVFMLRFFLMIYNRSIFRLNSHYSVNLWQI